MPKGEPNPTLRDELYEKEKLQPWYLYQELQKIDPEEANKLHPNSTRYLVRALEIFHTTWKTKTEWFFQQPVKWPILMLGLRREKEETNKRINSRIKQMMKDWLIEEVQWLLEQWYWSDLQSMQWIWYKETVWYIQKKLSKDDREEELKRNTHHLAKKQRTRFRRYIAEGKAQPKENVTYQNFFL
jgi:tRNA dimethylallyltransferase